MPTLGRMIGPIVSRLQTSMGVEAIHPASQSVRKGHPRGRPPVEQRAMTALASRDSVRDLRIASKCALTYYKSREPSDSVVLRRPWARLRGQSAPSAATVARAPLPSVALVSAANTAGAEEPVSTPDPRTRAFLEALKLGLGSRIPWAELLKRVYDVDALACSCGGRLRFIALILESDVARRMLDSLALESAPLPIARARSPDFVDCSPPADW